MAPSSSCRCSGAPRRSWRRWRPSKEQESLTRPADPVAAVTAISFLTRLPVGRAARDPAAVGAAAPFFPLAGALVLLGAGAVATIAGAFAPPLLAAALAVAFVAAATGALHLDALADAADALGGWSREERLRIMRDHNIGAFGATALCLTLLIETAAVAALVEHDASLTVFAAVGAASRGVAPALAAVLPYARAAEAATSVTAGFTIPRAVLALLVAAALCAAAGVTGLLVLSVAVLTSAAAGTLCRQWIGGVTGDTLGATTQLAELAGIVAAVAVS